MSYATVRAGLIARYATISGIKSNLDYLPTSVAAPGVYTVLDRVEFPVQAGLRVTVYHFDTWLFLSWQSNEAAEDLLDTYLPAVPAAIKSSTNANGADGTLGLQNAEAKAEDGQVTFVTISGTTYRAVRYSVRVKETNG